MGDKCIVGERVYVGTLFDKCHYMFSMERNVREYCWDAEDQAADLLDDIKDIKDDGDTNGQALDLGPVHLTKTEDRNLSEEHRQIQSKAQNTFFDVHDGQQRISTLCLLLAALRDELDSYSQDRANPILQCQNKLIAKVSEEITDAIAPTPGRNDNRVLRIVAPDRDATFLKEIFIPPDVSLVPQAAGAVATGKRSRTAGFTTAAARMKRVYLFYKDELHKLVGREKDEETGKELFDFHTLIDIYDKIMESCHFVFCTYQTKRVALNVVMSQQRGKNLDIVDVFKMHVCLNKEDKDSPEAQEETVKRWEELCEKTCRKTVETACLLMAQYTTGEQLRRSNIDRAINLFEKSVKSDFVCKKRGSEVFDSISQAVKKYHCFRSCPQSPDLFPNFKDEDKAKITPSLVFLSAACQLNAKEMEIAVLYALVQYQDCRELSIVLSRLESVALWMILCRPHRNVRLQRVFSILKELKQSRSASKAVGIEQTHKMTTTAASSSDETTAIRKVKVLVKTGAFDTYGMVAALPTFVKLSRTEKAKVKRALKTFLVQTATDKKIAKAVLRRLNLHMLRARMDQMFSAVDSPVYVESIVAVDIRNDNTSRLGNFVVTCKNPSKHSTAAKKKERFRECPYPLTNNIADLSAWKSQNLVDHLNFISNSATVVWDLRAPNVYVD